MQVTHLLKILPQDIKLSYLAGYLISWTPYCSIMAYGAFGDITKLNFVITIIPVIASKSTLIWCPVLEMIFNNSVRNNILVLQDPNTTLMVATNHTNAKERPSTRYYDSDSRYRYFDKYVRGWKAARSDVYDFVSQPMMQNDRFF